eukprot:scaffold39441_cov36-Phaeocystis_antarctica.AAC.1
MTTISLSASTWPCSPPTCVQPYGVEPATVCGGTCNLQLYVAAQPAHLVPAHARVHREGSHVALAAAPDAAPVVAALAHQRRGLAAVAAARVAARCERAAAAAARTVRVAHRLDGATHAHGRLVLARLVRVRVRVRVRGQLGVYACVPQSPPQEH